MNEKRENLIAIVGQENVFDDPKTVETYAHDQSFSLPIKPCFLVRPKNVVEVQGIVKWANQTRTPLVPISSGPPHFHGDTVPSATEATIVDLSRMNQIFKIDRRNRMAYIEPGVTYTQLQPELAKEGLRLSTPLLPRANKSVIASLLEREPILVPKYQWAMLDPLRCLEVVWGDSKRMMTGEAGALGSMEEEWKLGQAQLNPRGPAQTDFYKLVSAAQGSMGIVTWASIKCEVLPEFHKFFFVPSQKLDDLIDFTYRLLKFRFGDELLILNNSELAAILGRDSDNIKVLAAKLPPWAVIVGIAGRDRLPKERVEYQEQDISDIAQHFDLQLLRTIPGARDAEILEAILSPSEEPYWKLRTKGGCHDIFFLTTLNRTPEFLKTMYSIAEHHRYPVADIGVYIQPVHQGVSCHCEFSLPYNPAHDKEVHEIRDFFIKASEELLKQGAYYSRPYGIWANMAFNRDAQTTILLKKVKGIFDPNNVMNPGKLCF